MIDCIICMINQTSVKKITATKNILAQWTKLWFIKCYTSLHTDLAWKVTYIFYFRLRHLDAFIGNICKAMTWYLALHFKQMKVIKQTKMNSCSRRLSGRRHHLHLHQSFSQITTIAKFNWYLFMPYQNNILKNSPSVLIYNTHNVSCTNQRF